MSKPLQKFWDLKLKSVKKALEGNGFTCHVVADRDAARRLLLEELVPGIKPESVAFGGSMTVVDSGVYQAVKDTPGLTVLDTYDLTPSPEERIEIRRQALLTDLFITSTNALTEDGVLVNLDGSGNRVAALCFGPRNVVVLAGRNKIAGDAQQAMDRVKTLAAPANAIRLSKKTPCVKTGHCHDCDSPERICSVWTLTEKSFPKGRITVILINEDLGF